MIAVFVNCSAIILGSLVGLVFSKKISAIISGVISTAAGVITLVIGMQMALKFSSIVYLALSLILGGIVGTALDIDKHILDFGSLLEKLISSKKKAGIAPVNDSDNHAEKKKKDFAHAFLNASVLFCVGAMAILGSLQAGIQKNYTLIFTKSVLDGFMAIVFAAAMGIGTAFAAIPVFLFQGSITLLASHIAVFITEQMLGEVTAMGGVLLLIIGFNLTGIKQIKTANYLPGLVFIVLFVIADPYIAKILPL